MSQLNRLEMRKESILGNSDNNGFFLILKTRSLDLNNKLSSSLSSYELSV